MKFFSQTYTYDAPWPIVSLAFFLRYPNPYAAHVVSCDVVSRTFTDEGALRTTRLILKRGALPRWAPKGIVQRAESWILEESEVDPVGRVVSCKTRNLEHVKVLSVHENISLRAAEDGKTLQTSQVSVVSRFGWGLTKKIEDHGLAKFQSNIRKSREGLFTVLQLLRQQPMALGLSGSLSDTHAYTPRTSRLAEERRDTWEDAPESAAPRTTRWTKLRSWFRADADA